MTENQNQSSSNFKPEELVGIQGRKYPVVGGRLRLAHEAGIRGITTEIVEYTGKKAVIKATVFMVAAGKDGDVQRPFNGYGEADENRDRKLAMAVLELAETRAIARALRFAGFGVEYTGAEEMPRDDDDPKAQSTGGPSPAAASPSAFKSQTAPSLSTASPSRSATAGSSSTASPSGSPAAAKTEPGMVCEHPKCGIQLTRRVWEYSNSNHGGSYCMEHQKLHPGK